MYDLCELADLVDDVQGRGEVGTLPVLARGSRIIAKCSAPTVDPQRRRRR